jgi:very-short-patch-repair endonuclease
MRANPTSSESALWGQIRSNQLGVAFRRQVPIGRYIADFLAPSVRLIVEVDGGYHSQRAAADARRDRNLRRLGYTILHLEAALILQQMPLAVNMVRAAVAVARKQ